MEFEDTRDADDAVYELNGKELCGERVVVEHARGPRRDRDGYGGGWGSGRSKSSLIKIMNAVYSQVLWDRHRNAAPRFHQSR